MKFVSKDRQLTIARYRLQILTSFYELQKDLPGLTPLNPLDAAEALGTRMMTIYRWEEAWKNGGLDGLGAVRGIRQKDAKESSN